MRDRRSKVLLDLLARYGMYSYDDFVNVSEPIVESSTDDFTEVNENFWQARIEVVETGQSESGAYVCVALRVYGASREPGPLPAHRAEMTIFQSGRCELSAVLEN